MSRRGPLPTEDAFDGHRDERGARRADDPGGGSRDPDRRLFVLGVLVGAAAVVLAQSPVVHAMAALVGPDSVDEGLVMRGNGTAVSATGVPDGPLRIASEDARYLNRIFRERTHEVGYCGLIESGRLRPWLADTIRTGETSLEYVTDNCPAPDGRVEAVLHTHPNGNTMLSKADVRALAASPHGMMCVQGGRITAESGVVTENLRCYRLTRTDAGDALHEVRVVVVDAGDG